MSHLLSGGLLGYKKKKSQTLEGLVLSTSPIGFWHLNETSGTDAVNVGTLGTDANGTHQGDTLAQVLAPNGGLAPSFNGTSSYVNLSSPALKTALDGRVSRFRPFTMGVWAKVSGLADWTDSTVRRCATMQDGGFWSFAHGKSSTNNTLDLYERGTTESTSISTNSYGNTTDWIFITGVAAQNATNEPKKLYVNGSLIGSNTTDFNYFGDFLNFYVGCYSNYYYTPVNTDFWKGYLSDAIVWDYEVTQPVLQSIYLKGAGL